MGELKHQVVNDPTHNYLRLDPIPSREEVDKLYLDEFYAQNTAYFNNSSLETQIEQSEYQRSRWQRNLDLYRQFRPDLTHSDPSVFDIGFGFAQALLFFRENGFQVSGLEPSSEGVAYARERGINAFQMGIENLNELDVQKQDLILFLNVLEHLREPAKTLHRIRDKLMHDRSVLVVEVPNDFNDFQIAANDEFDLEEWWVLAPNHINYFSHTSLKILLEQCGYKILHNEASFPLELFLLFGDVYIGDGALGKSCHDKRVAFESRLEKHGKSEKLNRFNQAMADLDLGRSAIVYATPA
ncbi:MAG: class I SAM-dependent methyltransferase [Pseudomonadota bacterium]